MERKGLPESHQKHMEVIADEVPGKNYSSRGRH